MDKGNRESDIPWMQDDLATQSTSLPDILEGETHQIVTVIIFVISAVLLITLLFVIAVFIDCRQQKLQKIQSQPKRRVLRIKLPTARIGRTIVEEEDTIVDKMEEEPSSHNVIV